MNVIVVVDDSYGMMFNHRRLSKDKTLREKVIQRVSGRVLRMNIVVNKVVVERHTSDKSKQYAILVEKNPLVEKLRQELNLEVAR